MFGLLRDLQTCHEVSALPRVGCGFVVCTAEPYGTDRHTAKLIGKPGLTTPQGEVRSLIGPRRPQLASQRRRRGVQSSSGVLPLAPAWAINGRSRIWLQNAGDVLIWRPVSVQVPLILVTSKFGWERGRKSGDQGTLPSIAILCYVTFPTKKQRSMRLVQISAVGPQL